MVITFMALGLSAAQGAAPVQGDQQWTRQEASGLQHFVLLHEESSGWVAESFGRAPGKLQEVEWRRSFSQHEEALAFLKPALQGFARYAQPNTELSLPTESVTEVKGAVLWKATQKWSWDWELKYSQWVIDNVDSNFFVLHQIQNDHPATH